jgi:hypothetical protein
MHETGTDRTTARTDDNNLTPAEPVEAHICGAAGCHRDADLHRVEKEGLTRVLCRVHAADFLGVIDL